MYYLSLLFVIYISQTESTELKQSITHRWWQKFYQHLYWQLSYLMQKNARLVSVSFRLIHFGRGVSSYLGRCRTALPSGCSSYPGVCDGVCGGVGQRTRGSSLALSLSLPLGNPSRQAIQKTHIWIYTFYQKFSDPTKDIHLILRGISVL